MDEDHMFMASGLAKSGLKWGLRLLIIISILVAFVPISPSFPDSSLDGSWAFAMNASVAKHLVFGRDVVFTFGPYSSAFTRLYHPATDSRMLWSTLVVALAFLSAILTSVSGRSAVMAVILAVVILLVERDTLFLLVPFVVLLVLCDKMANLDRARSVPRPAAFSLGTKLVLAICVVTLGLLPLIKGTFAAGSGLVMALGCFLLIQQGEILIAIFGALLFLTALAFFWFVANQPLAGLPTYFISQIPVITGYSDAMSLSGPAWPVVLFLLCCLLLGWVHTDRLLAARMPGQVLLVGSCILLFLAFKEGFVRQDSHTVIAVGFLATVSCLISSRQRGLGPILGIVAGLATWGLVDYTTTGRTMAMIPGRIASQLVADIEMLSVRLQQPDELVRRYNEALRVIRLAQDLPVLNGSVDVYPVGQSEVLARNLEWDPRPVPQSYSAYTPQLAQWDADHVLGADAPDNIVFSIQGFGDRLPSLEDGASWPALLTRYDIKGFQNDNAILFKRSKDYPQPISRTPSVDGEFRLGKPVPLPGQQAALWAQLDVSPTFLGRLVALAYKPPLLEISYVLSDGRMQKFRYTAGMGHGFLLAPVVASTADFVALRLPVSTGYFAGHQPVSFTISATYGAGWLWRDMFHARVSAASFPTDPAAGHFLSDPVVLEASRVAHLPATSDCSFDLINQQRPDRLPVESGAYVRAEGWAAISVKDSLGADSVSVVMTAADGTRQVIQARKTARDDVTRYYGKPELGQVGYMAAADLVLPSGDYRLGLEMFRNHETWVCTKVVPVHLSTVARIGP